MSKNETEVIKPEDKKSLGPPKSTARAANTTQDSPSPKVRVNPVAS